MVRQLVDFRLRANIRRPDDTAVVTLASGGYPGSYETGFPITGLENIPDGESVLLFHDATRKIMAPILPPAAGCLWWQELLILYLMPRELCIKQLKKLRFRACSIGTISETGSVKIHFKDYGKQLSRSRGKLRPAGCA